jgi:4-hydroxyphenylpyruvate dioxygenase
MEIESIQFSVNYTDRLEDLLIDKIGLQVLKYYDEFQEPGIEWANDLTYTEEVGTDRVHFTISSPCSDLSPIHHYLNSHPSGVGSINFQVDNLDEIRQRVDRLGLKIPIDLSTDRHFPVLRIQGWGSIEHTISQAPTYPRIDGWRPIANNNYRDNIIGIDHIVLNVPVGELDAAVAFYRDIFDFRVEQSFVINTDRSGLFSQALISECGKIRFNINEPSSDESQIQEFLDLNRGAGIQHIAISTDNIFQTVDRMQRQGLEFLPIPETYYCNLKKRDKGRIKSLLTSDELQSLEHLQILVDWAEDVPEALLLQTFTKPIFERPTFFFEIIERRDRAQGFGEGNFQALFEAVERHNDLNRKFTTIDLRS